MSSSSLLQLIFRFLFAFSCADCDWESILNWTLIMHTINLSYRMVKEPGEAGVKRRSKCDRGEIFLERQSVVARCDISSTWYSIICQCYRCATYLLILFSRWICLKFLLNHWNVHTPVDSFSEKYRSTYARCVRNKVSLWYAIYARDMMKSRKARIPIFCVYCEIHTIPCAPRTIQNSFFRRSSLFALTSRHLFIKWANPSKNGSNGNVLPARENWLGDDITHVSDTFYNIDVMWWVCTERESRGLRHFVELWAPPAMSLSHNLKLTQTSLSSHNFQLKKDEQ